MAQTYYNEIQAIKAFLTRVIEAGAATGSDDLLERLGELLPLYGTGLIVELEADKVTAVLTQDLAGVAEDDSLADLGERLDALIEETESVL